MKTESRDGGFRISQMIYERLLLAYPRSHRMEYGPAMRQLFRDQCRDAWSESRNWGLLKLWLRILPDLASTSIMERLAASKQRKTMNDKLANLFRFRLTAPTIIFFWFFAEVFLVVFTVSVAITYILPESYASTARIKPEFDLLEGQPSDQYLFQAIFEMIQSERVLNPVIDKLNLNTEWGKKYFNGATLKTSETMVILKQRVQLAPVKKTTLISITVYSDDKMEAARIANAIADSTTTVLRQQWAEDNKLNPLNPQHKTTLAYITDTAVPGSAPVKPNKPLNIFIGAVAGIFLATAAGAVFAFLSYFIGKRMGKTAGAT
jgi:capsular polysaccharide biosynthesis protein